MCPGCGGTRFSKLGEDVTEVLEKIPARLKVIRHIRPKLSCRCCERILQAPMPDLPIEKGRPGPGLVANVVVSKYLDGLPLYRQSAILAREGIAIERATLADWVGHAAWWVTPLAALIGAHVMAAPIIHTDDTPIAVLAPGNGKTRTGRLWTSASGTVSLASRASTSRRPAGQVLMIVNMTSPITNGNQAPLGIFNEFEPKSARSTIMIGTSTSPIIGHPQMPRMTAPASTVVSVITPVTAKP